LGANSIAVSNNVRSRRDDRYFPFYFLPIRFEKEKRFEIRTTAVLSGTSYEIIFLHVQ